MLALFFLLESDVRIARTEQHIFPKATTILETSKKKHDGTHTQFDFGFGVRATCAENRVERVRACAINVIRDPRVDFRF